MIKVLAILGLVALATGSPIEGPEPFSLRMDGRIVGGEATTIEQAPHQVSLQISGRHFCGGSIIGARWVLTAGHCVSYPASQYRIRSGATKVNEGTVHRVERVIRHQGYSSNRYGVPVNDIALLEIVASDAFKFSNSRKAASLFSGNAASLVGKNALVTGWGQTNSGTPTVLQKVTVPMIAKAGCDAAYKSWGGVPAGEICAGYDAGGKDSCQGDSGGPLVVDGKLTGIVSWGKGCGTPKFPGVYTDVAYYRPWIKQHTGI